ncbi:thiamine ABC transporter substrate-binding protein [Epidermidibacterium keratini]|uniref:Thiamine ABC transporter substrate-binding protein n=1 Tax=Epidermidibacterium keratini TaxID=1891644 RepID=A0A7L4YPW3_9ACTN|nr:thiamine ABC transporter substrate-binding protein [Epidermidibacterium keratini]QHC00597.1 thiamine ABC transporter substrate-binding protein [Epidermidibacterium keratini]
MSHRTTHRVAVLGVTAVVTFALSACGIDSVSSSDSEDTLVVVTHDSWAAPDELIAQFEKDSGITLDIQTGGDAGEVTNKLVLGKDDPIGDVVYGIDNTFATRAIDAGVLEPYAATLPQSAAAYQIAGDGKDQLTPIDYGDVCINVDNAWFTAQGITPPVTLDDLTKPEYQNLTVAPGAATSSPGMAFLLATIGAYGEDGWQAYWSALMANGLKLVSGWSDAYSVDFSGGEGKGDRPIVVSYASSPPFTIPEGGTAPTTSALLDTCFRQVEYAGIVKGTEKSDAAKEFIDFLVSKEFQAVIPDNMYVYPVDDSVSLPQSWAEYAQVSPNPFTVDPQTIAANRDAWLSEWSDITSG